MPAEVEIRNDVVYAQPDGVELQGDLYMPAAHGSYPALVTVHGGGWERGQRSNHRYWGLYLAARGYVVFAVTYRRSQRGRKSYPAAVADVRSAVRFVKENAPTIKVDAGRVGLMGDSAGAHLAALVALAGDNPVKVLVGNYGVYDLAAHWEYELGASPGASAVEQFLGVSLLEDRKTYFDASPLSYVTTANNSTAVLLAYGTEDDVVDRKTQSEAFLTALKRARFYARAVVVQGAGHYWASEPIEEHGSSSAHLATRLVRFLGERL